MVSTPRPRDVIQAELRHATRDRQRARDIATAYQQRADACTWRIDRLLDALTDPGR